MGITGLLGFVKSDNKECSAIRSGHISYFRGKKVAVDAYSWLHKAVFTCAYELFMGKSTTKYVDFCIKKIKMLQTFMITPILVFDGGRMPFKVVEEQRRKDRKVAKERASFLVAAGKSQEAYNHMVQAIDVSHEMAFNLIRACRAMGVDCIVAPYEADAQLAYLERKGIVDFVITEDSDLIVYGCRNIFYKLNYTGEGEIYNRDNLDTSMRTKSVRYGTFSFDKFRHATILSGCDFLKNIPGVGLMKAWKFINMTENSNIRQFLKKVPSYLNLNNATVDEEYIDNFINADFVFRYMPVFDPELKQRVPLSEVEEKTSDYLRFIGMFDKTSNDHLQMALGNVDCKNRVYDDFSIDDMTFPSIYSQGKQSTATPKSKVGGFAVSGIYKNAKKDAEGLKRHLPADDDESNDGIMELYGNIKMEKVKKEEIEPPKKKTKQSKFFLRKKPSIDENTNLVSRFFCKTDNENIPPAEVENTPPSTPTELTQTDQENEIELSPVIGSSKSVKKDPVEATSPELCVTEPEIVIVMDDVSTKLEVDIDLKTTISSYRNDFPKNTLREVQNIKSNNSKKPVKSIKRQPTITGFFKKL